jgi:hypothetical protein
MMLKLSSAGGFTAVCILFNHYLDRTKIKNLSSGVAFWGVA